MRKLVRALGLLCLALGSAYSVAATDSSPATSLPGVTASELSHQAAVHWVSVEQIEQSLLGRPPMAVGFDVDDTLLFSSPGYWRGQKELSPGSRDFLKHDEFWDKMNNDWAGFSMPKEIARELISMHLRRGDTIWFFTHRGETPNEQLTRKLQEDFLIPAADLNPVIFLDDRQQDVDFVGLMRQRHIRTFYGDSDEDIQSARMAGARAIRVLRASNSVNKPLPRAGAFGEEVVTDSDY
ncbi:class B acid phosphatase [Salmonella enterica subsp. enterica serovar Choleraesuis]|nr:class B acid phosphatase [Salmonella enterica subsp. enterica serovar Choleraesuis]